MNDKVQAVSYSASSFVTVLAAWNTEYLLMAGGLIIAALTFFMTWYYRSREYRLALAEELRKYEAHQADQRRKDELHNARMTQLSAPDENNIRP